MDDGPCTAMPPSRFGLPKDGDGSQMLAFAGQETRTTIAGYQ